MPKATVIDIERKIGEDRARVRGHIRFGYRESLDPTDIKLKTVDFINLSPLNLSGGVPIGSVYLHGYVGSHLEGAQGSTVLLLWRVGSGPGDTHFGSVGTGTKTCFFEAIGRA